MHTVMTDDERKEKQRLSNKKYYEKHKERLNAEKREKRQRPEEKEKQKEYAHRYYLKNKERLLEKTKKYDRENKELNTVRRKKWRQKNAEHVKNRDRTLRKKYKMMVYEHYGKDGIKCACCGEDEIEFLTLDHIYNNGGHHRKKLGYKHLNHWIIQNNYPPIFQLLCMNCNFAKGKNGGTGRCPHEEKLLVNSLQNFPS